VKSYNQVFSDLLENIQPGAFQLLNKDNEILERVSLEVLQVKSGYHCKLNDILHFCQKIERGEVIEPIVVNQSNMIVDGVKRYYAYKRHNYKFLQITRSKVFIEEFIGDSFRIIKN
jgi:hypothetical protein